MSGDKSAAAPKSLYHQLATASLFAAPVAVALNILSQTSSDLQMRLTAGRLAALFGGLILVLGFLAGVVALFGLRRYGPKGILVKALVGMLLSLVMAAGLVPEIVSARAQARETAKNPGTIEEQLTALAAKLNARKGESIDANTKLAGAEALPGRTLVYQYTVLNVTPEAFPPGLEIIQAKLLAGYQMNPQMKNYRDKGVTVIYRYVDETGKILGEAKVGPDDLKK